MVQHQSVHGESWLCVLRGIRRVLRKHRKKNLFEVFGRINKKRTVSLAGLITGSREHPTPFSYRYGQ
jgi:hypothetical protein